MVNVSIYIVIINNVLLPRKAAINTQIYVLTVHILESSCRSGLSKIDKLIRAIRRSDFKQSVNRYRREV